MRVHPRACVALLVLAPSAHAQAPVDAAPPPAGNPVPPPSDLEAGGLQPPEAVDSAPPTERAPGEAQVEQELDQADTEDTGRGLEFVWLNGEVGYQMVSLQVVDDGDDAGVDGTAVELVQRVLVFGVGLGVRLLTITLGARFRYGNFDAWNMWSINAEGAFHIPLGSLDLYFGLGAGYAAVGGFQSDASDALSDLRVSGYDVRASVGLDYYISSTFSVGVNLGGEVMDLKRSGGDTDSGEPPPLYTSGSGIGAAFTPMAVLGLHF